ncbi:right-handed parallel beta-helix repeat-containing protein [Candidatus Eisenbacteria bacterium]|uniref:Right-handed parallel beta-helix repeat-containing protein n=1 Tax=Eiseniibacteriota bacterium TaxID=2212470 RepID=A0ABV6YMZ1_UNCEI
MRRLFLLIAAATLLVSGPAIARTWNIEHDGTGDAPTILAGIDSASAGDTVLVLQGTYHEHDIHLKSGVLLTAQHSIRDLVVIDALGQGRVLVFDGVDATCRVQYLTLTGGHATGTGSDGSGGGVFCTNYSAPAIHICYFHNNTADNLGGGAYCEDHSSPTFSSGVFYENQAGVGGGGIACRSYSNPSFDYSTLKGNWSANGGGLYCSDNSSPALGFCTFLNCLGSGMGGGMYSEGGSTPSLTRCIIGFSADGEGAYADDDGSIPAFNCCDIYGNEGGDWVGRIASQNNTVGNFTQDPLFCDTLEVESGLSVEACSPCVFGNHPAGAFCGAQIGNTYPDCGCGEATEPSTWGAVKSLYR